jgi:hypothetical protein
LRSHGGGRQKSTTSVRRRQRRAAISMALELSAKRLFEAMFVRES